MRGRHLFITLILFNFSFFLQAQNPNAKIIKDAYFNFVDLSKLCQELKVKYGVNIDIAPDVNQKEKITYWFDNVALDKGFQEALKGTPFKSYLDDSGVLHIILKTQKLNLNEFKFAKKSIETPKKFDFKLNGKIIDSKSGEPLPFASVQIMSTLKGVQSNVDGLFSLPKVPSDTVRLSFKYLGYRPKIVYLNPSLNFNDLTIELDAATGELDEVVVVGEKTEVMKANEEIGMYKITPKNIAKLPNIGEKDIFRAFQLLPGISAANQNSSGLYVRGGTPDQNLVTYDGFTVYYVDHLYGFFSAFNSNPIKDVQLFKGGFESKFGGRISSVMEITSKNGNNRNFNVLGDLSAMSANIMAEGPIGKKFTFLVAGRRSWAGPLYTKIADALKPSSANNTPGGFGSGGGGGGFGRRQFQSSAIASSYFYDLNGKINFTPNAKDIYALSLYMGNDNMDNSQNVSLPFGGNRGGGLSNSDLSQWGNTGGSLKWSRSWSSAWYSNTLISYSNFHSNRDNTNQSTFNRTNGTTQTVKYGSLENNDLKDFSFKSDIEGRLSDSHLLGFGVQATDMNIQFNYSQNDTVKILDKVNKSMIYAGYFQDKMRLFNRALEITPGIRANYFGVTSQFYFEPRLSAQYFVNKNLKFKGAFGNYYQFAKQVEREDILSGSRNFWVLADNKDLPVTSAKHFIIGTSYEKGDYLFDVEAYYKDIQNDTRYTLRFTPRIGAGLVASETFYNGTGTVRGIDFLFQKKFGNLTGWIGYTLAKSEKNIQIFSPDPFPSNFDVRHEFKVVGIYKWRQWDFSSSFLYATGKPYTSILGGYSVTLLDGSVRDYTEPSTTNGNRFPSQHRLDLAATYNFKMGTLTMSVFNVYNHNNVWYKKFQTVVDPDTNDRYLSVTDVNYLGFTPNLTLSLHLN